MICTRAEFCTLAGISRANLSTYIGRDKVVLANDGKTIDTEHVINKEFLQGRKEKGKGLIANENTPSKPATGGASGDPPEPSGKMSAAAKSEYDKKVLEKKELELKKMRAELDKKLVDTRVAEQKLSILKGNNIPLDVVQSIVAQFSKAIINNYKSFAEQQITEFCHKQGISEEIRIKHISENIKGLNLLHKKAVRDAKKQTKAAIGKKQLNDAATDE